MRNFLQCVAPFLAGLLMALGIGLCGMLEPQKVVDFLDIAGHWDPTLLFVMGGALATHATLYLLIKRRKRPLFGDTFHLPQSSTIDRKLIFGAFIFGAGWGICGLCPGPALIALASLDADAFLFVSAMTFGIVIANYASARTEQARSQLEELE